MKVAFVAAGLLCCPAAAPAPPAAAVLAFAATLGDEMVLQAAPPQSIVWGPLGDAAATVSVSWQASGSDSSSTQAAPAQADTLAWLGLKIWTAKLPPVPASFVKYTITATPDAGSPVSIANVTFGEVWLCSGQSNMGYTIAGDTHCFNKTRNVDGSPNCSKEVYGTCGGRSCVWNAGKEVADMKSYPNIRLMDVQQRFNPGYGPQFAPIPQAGSSGWHRPDQYAGVRGSYLRNKLLCIYMPGIDRSRSDCRCAVATTATAGWIHGVCNTAAARTTPQRLAAAAPTAMGSGGKTSRHSRPHAGSSHVISTHLWTHRDQSVL